MYSISILIYIFEFLPMVTWVNPNRFHLLVPAFIAFVNFVFGVAALDDSFLHQLFVAFLAVHSHHFGFFESMYLKFCNFEVLSSFVKGNFVAYHDAPFCR